MRRYLSSCALIMVVGLAILGIWTMSRLQQAVETEVGHRAATVLQSMLYRHAEDLAANTLPPELHRILDNHFRDISTSLGVSEMKIWNAKGMILYASRPEMTGHVLPISANLAAALAGKVMVNVDDEFHAGEAFQAASPPDAPKGTRLFEIYVPIRIRSLNQIVAVAEYYQNAAVASETLARARWQTWILIASVGLLFVTVLFLVLRHSDAVILRQRADLGSRTADLTRLLDQTRESQSLIRQEATRQRSEREAEMRQINADIHDGIGQLLTVALLRMKPAPLIGSPQDDDVQAIRLILEEAMSEVQALLTGTCFPQLHQLPLARAVRTIIDDHVQRTATTVDAQFDGDLPQPALPIKIAIFRLVQEGLHNAFKHAAGQDQQVRLQTNEGRLVVLVRNSRTARKSPQLTRLRPPMGLRNLRYRVERLGGTFDVLSSTDNGVEIRASFILEPSEVDDD